MSRTYNVLVRSKGGWKLYRACNTPEEASLYLDRLNTANLDKVFKRAKARAKGKGHTLSGLTPKIYQEAFSKTCIQSS